MKIKAIVADDVLEMRETIEAMLKASDLNLEIVALCEDGNEVLKVLSEQEVDVVLMDINMPIMNGLEATALISERHPKVNVIMMSVQHESEYLKKAMFSGAKAYIMKPVDMSELTDTIKATTERYKWVKESVSSTEQKPPGKIATFFSAKGGVGKSFLALNMAFALNDHKKMKVLVLDLDLKFGDMAWLINKHKDVTLAELIKDVPLKDYELLKPYLHTLKPGLDFLLAPHSPEEGELITKGHIESLIALLKPHYDWIVVDTSVNFDDVTLLALDLADKLFVVSNQEVTGIKNTKLALNIMKNLQYGLEKVKVIVNMSQENFGVKKVSVEKAFPYEVIGYVPEMLKIARPQINSGIPEAYAKGALSKSFLKLTKAFVAS